MRKYIKEKRLSLVIQLLWIAAFAAAVVLLREKNPAFAKVSLVLLVGGLYTMVDSFLRWRARSKLGEAGSEGWSRAEQTQEEVSAKQDGERDS